MSLFPEIQKNSEYIPFFMSQNFNGYIDDGYIIDISGMCTGNLINSKGSNKVNLFAIDNKLSYKLNTINDPDQILIMSKDNKYIFPFSPHYVPGQLVFGLSSLIKDSYNPFFELISIIFAIKIHNISIPLASDYLLLIKLSSSSTNVVPGIDPNDPLISVKKAIYLTANPVSEMNSRPVKVWNDISLMLKVFSQVYRSDISNMCISFSTPDISQIPINIGQFDCRNSTSKYKLLDNEQTSPKNDLLFNTNNNTNNNITYIGIFVFFLIITIIIVTIIMMSSSKEKLKNKGGYYYF
jgi:hypothetical protein